jgi:hypothetical protein
MGYLSVLLLFRVVPEFPVSVVEERGRRKKNIRNGNVSEISK